MELRVHATSPSLSVLIRSGLVTSVEYPTDEKAIFEAARIFAQTEGFLPAPEAAYAIRAAIYEALKCKENGERKVIAFNVTGHAFLDLKAFQEKLSL